jgi:hypothetical protein
MFIKIRLQIDFCPILPQSSCTRSVGYFQQLDICRAVSTILVCAYFVIFWRRRSDNLRLFWSKCFFFRNIYHFHKLLNAKQVQQNKCPLTVSSTIRFCFKWPTWGCCCCYSYGRRKVWKFGGLGSSNVVGIICPLVLICPKLVGNCPLCPFRVYGPVK